MLGTRLPDAVMGEPGPGWEAWESSDTPRRVIAPPGSYMQVQGGNAEYLYVVMPDGHPGTLAPDRHSWEWHEDGTVTVTPSILCTRADHGHDWHGFLRRRAWSG
jgi:hypothetical protein